MSPETILAEAEADLRRGDRQAARNRLIQFIRSPAGVSNGKAWMLLSHCLDDPRQQADCQQRAQSLGYAPPPPSLQFDRQQIRFVINLLRENPDRYEAIQAVLRQYRVSFEEADRLVAYVEANHHGAVAAGHLGVSLAIAVPGLLIGLMLIAWPLMKINAHKSAISMVLEALGIMAGLMIGGRSLWVLIRGVLRLRVWRV